MIPFHKEIDFTVFYREHVVRKQSLADSADVMDEIKNLLFKGYFYLIKFALFAVKL